MNVNNGQSTARLARLTFGAAKSCEEKGRNWADSAAQVSFFLCSAALSRPAAAGVNRSSLGESVLANATNLQQIDELKWNLSAVHR